MSVETLAKAISDLALAVQFGGASIEAARKLLHPADQDAVARAAASVDAAGSGVTDVSPDPVLVA